MGYPDNRRVQKEKSHNRYFLCKMVDITMMEELSQSVQYEDCRVREIAPCPFQVRLLYLAGVE